MMLINSYRYAAAAPSASVISKMDAAAADGATSFNDGGGHTFARTGAAEVETGIPGFGGSCIYLDGNSRFEAPDSTDWNLLSSGQDYSVEAFVRFLTAPPGGWGAVMMGRGSDSGNNFQFRAFNSGLQWVFPGQGALEKPFSFAVDTTYHVYYGRKGSGGTTEHFLAVDGVVWSQVGSGRVIDDGGELRLGRASYGGGMHGYLAHRITRGLCRWTADFTPPAAPF